GEQYQRSYSAGVMRLGSRSEKESSGFVSALTKSRRSWPRCPEISCAVTRGTRMALSSVSPVETTPVTVHCADLPVFVEESPIPGCEPNSKVCPMDVAVGNRREASASPITHSCEPSANHRP